MMKILISTLSIFCIYPQIASGLTLNIQSPSQNQVFTERTVPVTFTSDSPLDKVEISVADEAPRVFENLNGAYAFDQVVQTSSEDLLRLTIKATDTSSVTVTSVIEIDIQMAAPTDPLIVEFTVSQVGSSGDLGYSAQVDHPRKALLFDSEPTVTDGEAIESYTWNMGDGRTSTEPKLTHIYANPGTYTVTLTVSTASLSETKTATIVVGKDDCYDSDNKNICPFIEQSKSNVIPMASTHFTIKNFEGRSLKPSPGTTTSVTLRMLRRTPDEQLPTPSEWDLSASTIAVNDFTLKVLISTLTALNLDPTRQYAIDIQGVNPNDTFHSAYADLDFSGTLSPIRLGVGSLTYNAGSAAKSVKIRGTNIATIVYDDEVAANQQITLQNLPLGPFIVEEKEAVPLISKKGMVNLFGKILNRNKSMEVRHRKNIVLEMGSTGGVLTSPITLPVTTVPATVIPGPAWEIYSAINSLSYGLNKDSLPRKVPEIPIMIEPHPSVLKYQKLVENNSRAPQISFPSPLLTPGTEYSSKLESQIYNNQVTVACGFSTIAFQKDLYMEAASNFKFFYNKYCPNGGCSPIHEFAEDYFDQPVLSGSGLKDSWYALHTAGKFGAWFDRALSIPTTFKFKITDNLGNEVVSVEKTMTYEEVARSEGKDGRMAIHSYGYLNPTFMNSISGSYNYSMQYLYKFFELKIPRGSYQYNKSYYLSSEVISTANNQWTSSSPSAVVYCRIVDSHRIPHVHRWAPLATKPTDLPNEVQGLATFAERSRRLTGVYPVSPFRSMNDGFLNDFINPYRTRPDQMEVGYEFSIWETEDFQLEGFDISLGDMQGNTLTTPVRVSGSQIYDVVRKQSAITGKVRFNVLDVIGLSSATTGLETTLAADLPPVLIFRVVPRGTSLATGLPAFTTPKAIRVKPTYNLALMPDRCTKYSTPYSAFGFKSIYRLATVFNDPTSFYRTAPLEPYEVATNFVLRCNDAAYPLATYFNYADTGGWPNNTSSVTLKDHKSHFGNSLDVRYFGPLAGYDILRENAQFNPTTGCLATPTDPNCIAEKKLRDWNDRELDVFTVFKYIANNICPDNSPCLTAAQIQMCLYTPTTLGVNANCNSPPRTAAIRLAQWVTINRQALTEMKEHEEVGEGLRAYISSGVVSGITKLLDFEEDNHPVSGLSIIQRSRFVPQWQYNLLRDGRFPYRAGDGTRPVGIGKVNIPRTGAPFYQGFGACTRNVNLDSPFHCDLSFVGDQARHINHIHLFYEKVHQ